MWSPKALAALALAGAAVSACTLTPVYAPGGAGGRLYGQVAPAAPHSQDDFAFARRIGERLGPNGARYDLSYRLRIAVVPQAITPDQVTTRYSLNGSADYVLRDRAAGTVLAQGQVSSFTSYSTIGTTIATMSGESDARERLAVMLADQVVTRLYAVGPAGQP